MVGDAGDDGEIVGDQEEAHAVLLDEAAQQIEDAGLGGDVEGGGGLVGDQEPRAQGDGHGDDHALALAPRKFVRIAREREAGFGQADPREGLAGDLARLGAAGAGVDQHGFGDLIADGPERIERGHRLLEDHADLAAANVAEGRLVEAEQIGAVEADVAGGRGAVGQQAHQGEGGHRLARAALADDAEHLAGAEGHRDVAQDRGAADGDAEAVDLEQAHVRTRRRRGSSRSRSPSPIRLRPSTVSTIASPGTMASQGAKEIMVWLSASIRPQDGVGGWAPRPT